MSSLFNLIEDEEPIIQQILNRIDGFTEILINYIQIDPESGFTMLYEIIQTSN